MSPWRFCPLSLGPRPGGARARGRRPSGLSRCAGELEPRFAPRREIDAIYATRGDSDRLRTRARLSTRRSPHGESTEPARRVL
jgi:hypothetical protein